MSKIHNVKVQQKRKTGLFANAFYYCVPLQPGAYIRSRFGKIQRRRKIWGEINLRIYLKYDAALSHSLANFKQRMILEQLK